MEISFEKEIQQLRLGTGDTFHGEGILAITKALLESGVAYIGGYQGAPVSHLLDVMVQAKDLVGELGVHVEACSNEASAAAMLGASIHYPLRGAVTWKSIVGTNVAADALANLSSPGVTGGVLMVIGEDYGEGASVVQERTHAYAMKSGMILLDPRPDLQNMVDMVKHAFAMSEASNMPAMMELRIRACHLRGSFVCSDNRKPAISAQSPLAEPAGFDYGRLAHPPSTFRHEKLKVEQRMPAARDYLVAHQLNELRDGRHAHIGIIVQGGVSPALLRALQEFGVADAFGHSDVPLLILNVTYPLAHAQIADFAAGKEALLVVEEGSPEYIEHEISSVLRRSGLSTALHGKDMMPATGELNPEAMLQGLAQFFEQHLTAVDVAPVRSQLQATLARRQQLAALLQRAPTAPAPSTAAPALPARPPGFCIGCPERPVFSALKQVQAEVGPLHIAADIGCHSFATFEPFSMGHSILGYGMSLASRAGVSPMMQRRVVSIMGDGGFWHNGLLTGVQSALFNRDDAVLLIFKNGYTSATGTQDIISTPGKQHKHSALDKTASLTASDRTIEDTLAGIGVQWLRTVHSYRVSTMRRVLREALTTDFRGLKVIVAEGECQLERQRRIRPWLEALLARNERVVRVKYGVDDDVCNGDHACMRLSGCPTLTLKDNPDPLKVDPVATVNDGCVGCGLCGENAHAATLCPSFYRAEVIRNPRWRERVVDALRRVALRMLRPA